LSTDPLDDWELLLDEANDTWGIGLNAVPAEGWKITADARYAKSDGLADFFSPPGGSPDTVEGFDNYEDVELASISLKADYALSEGCSVGLWYLYEDFTIDSFILQGLTNVLPGSLLLAPENGNYEASILGVNFKVHL
jgi:hypothetical protein